MSAASFLHSSLLQAIKVLWPVHVEKVPQASEQLCLAKLQTRCDICCACQSICPFIPTDSGVPRTVDPQKTLCVSLCLSGQRIPDSIFCRRFIESVRMMTRVTCVSRWETSHCIASVTASTPMVTLEVVTLWDPLSSCTVLPPCLTVKAACIQTLTKIRTHRQNLKALKPNTSTSLIPNHRVSQWQGKMSLSPRLIEPPSRWAPVSLSPRLVGPPSH